MITRFAPPVVLKNFDGGPDALLRCGNIYAGCMLKMSHRSEKVMSDE
jgi:hypothetical protein